MLSIGAKLVALTLKRSFWTTSTTSITKPEKIPLAYYCYNPKYLIKDDPSPVVILHSLYTSKEYFNDLAPLIGQKLARPVYLVDLRNHGESGHRAYDGRATLMIAGQDVINFIDEMQLKKVVLMGVGFGARVAVQLSQTNPARIDRLVSVDLSQDGGIMFAKTYPRFLSYLNDLNARQGERSLRYAKLVMKELLRGQVHNPMTLKYILEGIRMDSNQVYKWKFNELTLGIMLRNWHEVMPINYAGKDVFDGPVLNIVTKNSYLTSEDYLDLKASFTKQKVEYLNTRFLMNTRGGNLMKILEDFGSAENCLN